MKNFKSIMLLAMMVLAGVQSEAVAKVTLAGDFEGTVMITTPAGKVHVLSAGDPIPDIPSQSRIEIFDGKMKLSTEAGDAVMGVCGGNEASMDSAGSAYFSCSENQGMVEAEKGALSLRTLEGETLQIGEGSKKTISVSSGKAPAPDTAAGNETGIPVDLGIQPVDSRNLEASPSE